MAHRCACFRCGLHRVRLCVGRADVGRETLAAAVARGVSVDRRQPHAAFKNGRDRRNDVDVASSACARCEESTGRVKSVSRWAVRDQVNLGKRSHMHSAAADDVEPALAALTDVTRLSDSVDGLTFTAFERQRPPGGRYRYEIALIDNL